MTKQLPVARYGPFLIDVAQISCRMDTDIGMRGDLETGRMFKCLWVKVVNGLGREQWCSVETQFYKG